MKITRIKSALNGMYSYAVKDDIGRIYPITKDYKGRYMADTSKCIPSLQTGDTAALSALDPDAEHLEITRLLKNKRNAESRKAKHEAMLSIGMVRVRGSLGGVYYE